MEYQSGKEMRSIICALSLVIGSSGAWSAELSGTPEELRGYLQSETRTVTIRDNATETAYSDIAKITLIVSTEARELASAMAENNRTRDSIVEELVAAGVESSNIRTSKYSASPQFGWFGKSPSSFSVVNSLVVTVDDEGAFRRVAEISDREDSVSFSGAEFEHSEKEAYEDRVRDKALTAVLKERAYFEQKLGLTLKPVAFRFSDVHSYEPNPYGVLEEIVVTGSRVSSAAKATAAAPPSYDEIDYQVSLEVTFVVSGSE